MTDSNADRQRRYRFHKAGDHSLCLPAHCDDAPRDRVTSRNTPAGLRERGRQLWAELSEGKFGPAHLVLLEEACRLADHLDRLHAQLEGEDWLRFLVDEAGTEVTVKVDGVLVEARQHAVALKGLVAELRQANRSGITSKPKPASEPQKAGGNVRDLTSRVDAARRASSAS